MLKIFEEENIWSSFQENSGKNSTFIFLQGIQIIM